MSVMQVGIIGVVGAVLAVQLKGTKAEYAVYISVAAEILLLSFIAGRLEVFVQAVEQAASYVNIDSGYLSIMMRMIGITYIAEFSSGICRDAGYQTLAGQIEIFGKLTILVLGMPVLTALFGTIQEFLT